MFENVNYPIGTRPQQSSPSRTEERAVGRTYAMMVAKTILSRYPHTTNLPAEYLTELANAMADQTKKIVDRLGDRFLGVSARSPTYPPTVTAVTEMISSLRAMEDRAAHYAEVQARRPRRPIALEISPFRPYPRLWGAFAQEADIITALDTAHNFDRLTMASKTLATKGQDAARELIKGWAA